MPINMLHDFATGFDVNREHLLQALRPGHVHPVLGRRSITVRGTSVKHTISGMAVLRCICRSDILIGGVVTVSLTIPAQSVWHLHHAM